MMGFEITGWSWEQYMRGGSAGRLSVMYLMRSPRNRNITTYFIGSIVLALMLTACGGRGFP
ncbi:hypothetical protein DCC26_04910 [Auritidibacter sp. NML120779]|nr:hypothetical protein DCC26_04910 [Auritidibacter sp. NML120779]